MRVLRRKQVLEKISVSHMQLWRWEKAGLFPGAIPLGPNSVGYLEDEVDAWIEARRAGRDKKRGPSLLASDVDQSAESPASLEAVAIPGAAS